MSILQFSYLLPVFGANEVVSGDGEDCLEVEGGPGGGVEGEGSDGAVDVICTAVPDTTRFYVRNRKKVEGWVVVILHICVCLQNHQKIQNLKVFVVDLVLVIQYYYRTMNTFLFPH